MVKKQQLLVTTTQLGKFPFPRLIRDYLKGDTESQKKIDTCFHTRLRVSP
jgi:hypothetical protein